MQVVAFKSTLQHGMKTNGPAVSVKLCNIQAPLITQGSTEEIDLSGWTVSRTSLKPRNVNNSPEAWVTEVLKDFDGRVSKGEDASLIAHSEIRDGQFY